MKAAIISASGFGDGLLMQIAAAHLKALSYHTVTFSNHLNSLSRWFKGFEFHEQTDDCSYLNEFDTIILQYDNSPKAASIRSLPKTYSFFASYVSAKHGPLKKGDMIFDRRQTMAKNIAKIMHKIYPAAPLNLDNGIMPPSNECFRKYPKRVAIHPLSSHPDKNWKRERYLKLADLLTAQGFEPLFIVPPDMAHEWNAPILENLDSLASILYESGFFIGNDSGPGHLASNLGIPTITIGPSRSHLALWRPGWAPGKAIAPPDFVTTFKLIRNKWQFFISVDHILQQFILFSEKHSYNQLKLEKEVHNERSSPSQRTAK